MVLESTLSASTTSRRLAVSESDPIPFWQTCLTAWATSSSAAQSSELYVPTAPPTKRLKDKREKHHHALKALAIREKKLHIVGSPEIKIDGTPVYLDVEGLPDRGFYYLFGIRTKEGNSVVQHSLWADEPSDEGRIWRTFLSKLTDIENLILIHCGSFETVFLKQMCERHGGPPNGSGAAKALESSVNLLSVIFGQIYFPTYSNGLKEIAGWLGFRWSDRDSSGLQSIVWTSGNKPKPRRSRTASSRIPNVSDDNQAPPRSKIQERSKGTPSVARRVPTIAPRVNRALCESAAQLP